MTTALNTIYLHGWGFRNEVFDLLIDQTGDACPCLYSLVQDTGYDAIVDAITDTITSDTVLVGWSMGGQIAIEVSLRTSRIKGLVLLASTPLLVNRPGWDVGIDNKAYQELCQAFSQDPARTLDEVMALTAYGDSNYKNTVRCLEKYAANPADVDALALLLRELGQRDLREALASLSIPVLMCAGENDALVNPRLFEKTSNSHLQTRLYPGCGHAPFVSRADEINGEIARFRQGLV